MASGGWVGVEVSCSLFDTYARVGVTVIDDTEDVEHRNELKEECWRRTDMVGSFSDEMLRTNDSDSFLQYR